jgi:PIN domain nuclease of toxin-antitoxin system
LKLLLDAPALLGVFFFPSFRLGARARTEIENLRNEIWVCPASAYEIEWKRQIGKLSVPETPDWELALKSRGYRIGTIGLSLFVSAASLPRHHRDPWDRLLIAQALTEHLTIVSPDRSFRAYGVPTLW